MPDASAAPVRRRRWLSVSRVLTIAGGTFTQLVRMKVFSFMAIFALVLIGASFAFADLKTEQELKMLKDVSFAAMALFSMLFAIAGTALLIPRDVEDRTLYTILCKPVPRLEYLIGKLTGVIWLLLISLVCMDVLFCTVLHFKEKVIVQQQLEHLEHRRFDSQEEREKAIAEITELSEKQGLRWNLQAGVVSIFLKSVVLAVVALVMSAAASSTLFSIMASLAIMVIGHAQEMAREQLLGDSAGVLARLVSGAVALIFPDFKAFDIIDAVVLGDDVPFSALAQMTGLTAIYLTLYLLAAWVIFADKEL
jgi:ABC-type Na+ efflux pump permease subunit